MKLLFLWWKDDEDALCYDIDVTEELVHIADFEQLDSIFLI